MKRAAIVFGIVLGAILLLLVVAAIALPFVFDPNDHRERVEKIVQEETGREFRIEDELSLSVFPWLGIETGRLWLADAEGFGEEPFFALEAAEVRVRLLPLLRGRVELGQVRVAGLRLNLMRDAEGRNNWDDLIDETVEVDAPPPEHAESFDLADLERIRIGGLRLSDAHIVWQDDLEAQRVELSELNLTLGELRLGEPLDISFGTGFLLADPAVNGRVEMAARVLADLSAETFSVDRVRMRLEAFGEELPGGELRLRADWENLSGSMADNTARLEGLRAELAGIPLEGRLDITQRTDGDREGLRVDFDFGGPEFPPARLAELLGDELPPELRLERVDAASWAATGRADLLDGTLDFDQLWFRLGPARVDLHELAVSRLLEEPVVVGRLEIPSFDLAGLWPAIAGLAGEDLAGLERGRLGAAFAFSMDTATDRLELAGLDVDLSGIRLQGTVQGRELGGEAAFSGELRLNEFNARERVAALGLAELLPETADDNVFTRVALQTRFDLVGESLSLEAMSLRLDDSRIEGSVRLPRLDPLAIRFELSLDDIDLDRYLPPDENGQPADETPLDLDAIELPVDAIRGEDVDGLLRAGRLRGAGMTVEALEARVRIANDRLELSPFTARLYGGRHSGRLVLDASGDIPRLEIEENLAGIQLGGLLVDLFDIGQFTGLTHLELRLEGRGHTVGELRPSLNGRLSFALNDGTLEGVDINHELRSGWAQVRRQDAASTDRGRTPISSLTASGRVQEGRLTSEDFRAALPWLGLMGSGSFSLVDLGMDYRLTARLTGSPDVPPEEQLDQLHGRDIPMHLTGSLLAPRISIDSGAILRQITGERSREAEERARQEAEERAREEAERRLRERLRR
jgi:AsmA protein